MTRKQGKLTLQTRPDPCRLCHSFVIGGHVLKFITLHSRLFISPDEAFEHFEHRFPERHQKPKQSLTIRKCQNTYDKEERDDQDEPHPDVAVTVSIIPAGSKDKVSVPARVRTHRTDQKTAVTAHTSPLLCTEHQRLRWGVGGGL